MERLKANEEMVRLYNGPGDNAYDIKGCKTCNLKQSDVVVIPTGTGHWFQHVTITLITSWCASTQTRSRRSRTKQPQSPIWVTGTNSRI